jgi:predicted nucleic acid-binding protein
MTMIQIRNVPDALHRRLKARAAEAGMTLSDYLLAELRALRYPVMELADVVWELRTRLTTYDAAYLALARRLGVRLVTLDGGLAAAAHADGRLHPLPA